MIYLLFDIDGTLIRSNRAGQRAIERALQELHGITQPPKVPYSGRTDLFIFHQILTACELAPTDESYESLKERYLMHLPWGLQQGAGEVLPGVRVLLDALAAHSACELGLLTGNLPESASTKLQHFELDHYFEFGVYGDHSQDRRELAEEASQVVRQKFGEHAPEQVWIIGDTEHDIRCGRHIGASTLGCGTGGCTLQQLTAEGATAVLENLADTQTVLEILGAT